MGERDAIGEALKGAGPLCDWLSCAVVDLEQAGMPGRAKSVQEAADMIRKIALIYHDSLPIDADAVERVEK